MKTKKKKIFIRIFSIFLICCFAFLCVGCMGSAPEDYEGEGGGDAFEEMAFDMYGAKVLYRPNSYDYNTGSGGTTENPNDYYGEYAWEILSGLYHTYGIGDNETLKKYLKEFTENGYNVDNLPYLYDSIRYKVDTVGTVNKLKTIDASGNESTSPLTSDDQYLIIGANINQSWNWSFDYYLGESNPVNALLYNDDFSYIEGNKLYNTAYRDAAELSGYVSGMYSNDNFKDQYTSIYLGTDNAADQANYSEYVKTLQYVIYCYALDLEPAAVTVNINDNVSAANPEYYTVQVGTYLATGDKSSADVALEDIKALFNKLGSYVGLVQRQIDKIAEWVKTNVIGWQSKVLNDNFFRYSSVTEVVTTDASGNETTTYEFDMTNMSSSTLGRNYAANSLTGEESAVDLILDAVCSEVSIGSDGDGDLTIDNRFLASEVKEYAGNTFLIAGDENFPKYEEGQNPVAIEPLEYQSVTFMLKEKVNIYELWVALKYDADLDGTVDGVWDENKYLDIIVEVNYFSHALGKLFTLGSQQTRVYDGPYELSGNYPSGFPDDHGTVFFSDFEENCVDQELKSLLVDGNLPVGAFNTDIGNGILKTDVGVSGYNGSPLVSKNPIVIVGTQNVRKYYQVIEPSAGEIANSNKTYITGRMNENMFKGSDGCDYLEITYKVLKNKGDANTNYKFYTGIAFVDGE